jgi:hypothetical protein
MSKKATKKSSKKGASKKAAEAPAVATPAVNPTVEIVTGQPVPKAKGEKKPRVAKSATPKRISALDAAAEVLKAESKPMRCKELIAAMAAKGLWSSPNGKTPEATLYSAILREIGAKGDQARFRKADRGQFEHAGK